MADRQSICFAIYFFSTLFSLCFSFDAFLPKKKFTYSIASLKCIYAENRTQWNKYMQCSCCRSVSISLHHVHTASELFTIIAGKQQRFRTCIGIKMVFQPPGEWLHYVYYMYGWMNEWMNEYCGWSYSFSFFFISSIFSSNTFIRVDCHGECCWLRDRRRWEHNQQRRVVKLIIIIGSWLHWHIWSGNVCEEQPECGM